MAMAASLSVVQTHGISELGAIAPDAIVTPGLFINRVINVANIVAHTQPAG